MTRFLAAAMLAAILLALPCTQGMGRAQSSPELSAQSGAKSSTSISQQPVSQSSGQTGQPLISPSGVQLSAQSSVQLGLQTDSQAGSQAASQAGAETRAEFEASDEAGPVKGSNEFEVWSSAGGAISINGSAAPAAEWDLGLRYGRVLTGAHGPSLLNGRFEYSFDIVPAFLVFQPHSTVYGGGFDPFAVKWDFKTRRHIAPFFEISGGGLFTTEPVPPRSSSFNFTPSVALGTHILRGKYAWSVDARWYHISNAHIIAYNPGINAVQVRIGFGLFTHAR